MNKQEALKILNLGADVCLEDAKKAYRELAKRYHPDLAGKQPGEEREADERMKEINLAFREIVPELKPRKQTHASTESMGKVQAEKKASFFWAEVFGDLTRMVKKRCPRRRQATRAAGHGSTTSGSRIKKVPGDTFEDIFIKVSPDNTFKKRVGTPVKRPATGKQQRCDAFDGYSRYMDLRRKMKKLRRSHSKGISIGRVQKIQPVNPVERVKR